MTGRTSAPPLDPAPGEQGVNGDLDRGIGGGGGEDGVGTDPDRLRGAFTPANRKAVKALTLAALAVIVAWMIGFLWFAGEIPKPSAGSRTGSPLTTDAIVDLTGGSERLEAGLDLLSQGRAKKLFVSGVYRGVDVTRLLRAARKAPADIECCVVLGYDADNTAGNAHETAAWMVKEGFGSLRVVTASYHLPRSLVEFRAVLSSAVIVPHPVHPKQFKHDEWWLWPGTAGLMIGEYNKYLMARARLGLFAHLGN